MWLDAVLILVVLSDLWLLGSSRLMACVQAIALQGFLLGLIPILSAWPHWSVRLAAVGLCTLILKAFVFPVLLRRAVREVNMQRKWTRWSVSRRRCCWELGCGDWPCTLPVVCRSRR